MSVYVHREIPVDIRTYASLPLAIAAAKEYLTGCKSRFEKGEVLPEDWDTHMTFFILMDGTFISEMLVRPVSYMSGKTPADRKRLKSLNLNWYRYRQKHPNGVTDGYQVGVVVDRQAINTPAEYHEVLAEKGFRHLDETLEFIRMKDIYITPVR